MSNLSFVIQGYDWSIRYDNVQYRQKIASLSFKMDLNLFLNEYNLDRIKRYENR